MTFQTFVATLIRALPHFRYVEARADGSDYVMRRYIDTTPRSGVVRTYCPITVVCLHNTGEYHHIRGAGLAGRLIGLRSNVAKAIIRWADGGDLRY